jgi:hypothetical protein
VVLLTAANKIMETNKHKNKRPIFHDCEFRPYLKGIEKKEDTKNKEKDSRTFSMTSTPFEHKNKVKI